MITIYIIGFFVTFVLLAFYNSRCKTGNEVSMPQAFLTSLFWPISHLRALMVALWSILEMIFKPISKK
jgi:hypothetical protein